ncbi:MAG: lipopolysaccharide assembly protein LapA domain-containing protein [Corynebacterium sp.]|nr:lipopolysaccharide assembly protein LapA domain-containing protein [Corynebacterium sp.]
MDKKIKGSLAGATWASLVAGILLLILLIIFIVQNPDPVEVRYFNWNFTLQTGVTVLLAAIVGAAVMALVGMVRMYQLRRQVKKRTKVATQAMKEAESTNEDLVALQEQQALAQAEAEAVTDSQTALPESESK